MQHSVPYTPHQNGVAERKNRALKEMATCMIEEKDLSTKLWVEAINCAAYVQNRELHKSVKGKTPYETWFVHKANVSHFIIFGSRTWAQIPSEKRKDLQPQRKECMMVCYGEAQRVIIYLTHPHSILSLRGVCNSKRRSYQILSLHKGNALLPNTMMK